MKASNQTNHEDILFNPNLHVVQKQRQLSRTEFVEDLIVDGVLKHRLVVTHCGSEYFSL